MMLEILHRPLVVLGGLSRAERAEIAATPGFGVLLARVQAILPRLQFSNHAILRGRQLELLVHAALCVS